MLDYHLIDTGLGKKLEQVGPYLIIRPCAQAIWKPTLPEDAWLKASAEFTRELKNQWKFRSHLPNEWEIKHRDLIFKIQATDFGHIGLFAEHGLFWPWMKQEIEKRKDKQVRVLNLFAYTGGATLAIAATNTYVCHVDASKGIVEWAKENAKLNRLDHAPIRWIVDDVMQFLKKEIKRKSFYDAIILDPPSFGRGNKGQVFKIENDLSPLLNLCKQVLSDDPIFILMTCHTPEYTPLILQSLSKQIFDNGNLKPGEIVLKDKNQNPLPCGSYIKWYV